MASKNVPTRNYGMGYGFYGYLIEAKKLLRVIGRDMFAISFCDGRAINVKNNITWS